VLSTKEVMIVTGREVSVEAARVLDTITTGVTPGSRI
jgi:hypothetical protein